MARGPALRVPKSFARTDVRWFVIELAALLFIGLPLGALVATSLSQLMLWGLVAAVLALVAFLDPRVSVVAILIYMLLMGTIRRITDYVLEQTGAVDFDLVLAVPPLVTGALFLVAVRRGALRDRPPLSTAVLFL